MVEQGQLSFGHAKALMGLDSPDTIQLMAQRVADLSLSVRQTEKLVTNLMHPPEKVEKVREVDPNVKECGAGDARGAGNGGDYSGQTRQGKGRHRVRQLGRFRPDSWRRWLESSEVSGIRFQASGVRRHSLVILNEVKDLLSSPRRQTSLSKCAVPVTIRNLTPET